MGQAKSRKRDAQSDDEESECEYQSPYMFNVGVGAEKSFDCLITIDGRCIIRGTKIFSDDYEYVIRDMKQGSCILNLFPSTASRFIVTTLNWKTLNRRGFRKWFVGKPNCVQFDFLMVNTSYDRYDIYLYLRRGERSEW
ncbi:cationic amino acid transporter 3, mitochondrial [Acrasis kona]|uniref:Cationic amino acid transporter 3, mitochondrial n=1 Tax=Acrasis kona TaxID=1008807 RepID=A0AAW2Z1V1_9EUKA